MWTNVWSTYSSTPACVGVCRQCVFCSVFHKLTVDGKTTYGSRTMWMKIACGNMAFNVLIRAVCGGDFNTSRLPDLYVTHLRKRLNARFQRRSCLGVIVSRSRNSCPSGGSFGNASIVYGEPAPIMHNANSSSCGRSKPAFMLSIGREDDIRNGSQRWKIGSVNRKSCGSMHS